MMELLAIILGHLFLFSLLARTTPKAASRDGALAMAKVAAGPMLTTRLAQLGLRLNPWQLTKAFSGELFFVASLGVSAYYLTALASFVPTDPSFLVVALPGGRPTNLAGTFGADLAALAVYTVGAVAWLVPLPLLSWAFAAVANPPRPASPARLCGWLLAFAGLTTLAALKVPTLSWQGFDLPSAGLVGSALSGWLQHTLGRLGAWIALATVSVCAAMLIGQKRLLAPAYQWTVAQLRAIWTPDPAAASASDQAHSDDADGEAADQKIVALPRQGAEDLPPVYEVTAATLAASSGMPKIATPRSRVGASSELDWASADDSDDLAAANDPVLNPVLAPHRGEAQYSNYTPPPLSVFRRADPVASPALNQKDLETTAALLVKTFADFGVHGQVIGFQPGPVVTVFEFQPDAGVKQAKVVGLIDDLALALKVDSIFIHPVRGKRALGVQVPNTKREQVFLGDILATASFTDAASPLTFGMGKTISGQPMCADLSAMPHLLVAGATGSGKSVGINSMLCSIIMKAAPQDVRMLLVDPKMLELSIYEGIPHLLMPVITEPTKASLALKWAAAEMERRYKLMQHAAVRNLAGFNEFWAKAPEAKRDALRDAVGDLKIDKLPYILLVIDELADLMMTAPKDVESSIQRLAQKARASGIHMVLATQRPSVDIITGVIKANLPCRIAFQVVSRHDSRTILDLIGAEKLLGKGDMLLQRPGIGRLERLQGALITDEEVVNLVAAVKAVSPVQYDKAIISWIDDEFARQRDKDGGSSDTEISFDDDPKWDEAVVIGETHGVISASFLQRHLKIGYNRAARMVEFMESRGLVDRADGAKPRKWLGGSAAQSAGLAPR